MRIIKYIFLSLIVFFPSLYFSQTSDSVNTQLAQVQEYIADKNYAQGISSLTLLLKENPNDNNIYRAYAELLLSFNQYDNAITNIQKAILLSKENPSNHVVAGNIYRTQKKYTNAQDAYAYAIKLAPNMGEAYSEFALLNLQYYFMQDAERLAELAYHYSPNSWQNIILRAKIAQQNRNSALSQKIFLEGIRNFPYNESLLDAFADFYISDKKPDKAIVILEEANARFGDSIMRNRLLGDLSFLQNNYPKALKYYEITDQTLSELPIKNTALLKWKLHNLYAIAGNIDKANEFLQKAFELEPANQLYISSFYNYLLSTDNATLKLKLSKHLEVLADQERKKGLGYYRLSLLQKIVELDPFNSKARNSLINYAKLQNNQYAINKLVMDGAAQDSGNAILSKTIALRNYLTKTKRLDTSKRLLYQYTNKIYIKDSSSKIGSSIQKEIKELEYFYPDMNFVVELDKEFVQESRTIFQRNTDYNTIASMVIDQENSVLNIEIFDKTGLLIDRIKHAFTIERLTENLINLIEKSSQDLPNIGYINKRLADSSFEISLGTIHDLTVESTVAILDKNFIPLTTATITAITPNTATIKQNATPLSIIDIKSAFIIPVEFVPSLNTNTTKDKKTVTTPTSIIKNIDQISQIRHTNTVDFSQSENN